MSDEKWSTVPELAEKFSIPQQTLRRYIDRHGHRLHIRKHHKSYLISDKSLPVIIRIREGYSSGMNTEQMEEALSATGTAMILNMSDDGHEQVSGDIVNTLYGLEKGLSELITRVRFNDERSADLEEKIERLTEIIIQHQQTAAAVPSSLDPEQQRAVRLNDRITERRIERQLEREALELWEEKPEAERMRKAGWFRKEEDTAARERFIRDYADEHFEARIREAHNPQQPPKFQGEQNIGRGGRRG